LIAIIGGIVVLALGGIVLWLQFGHGYTPKIKDTNSVTSLEQVRLGRFKQWILIRGTHRSSPILLFLHGGPGMPMMYLEHAFGHELEQHFIVVEWDRLGAGKSYRPNIPVQAMSVSREIADTHQLIELLCARFGKKKVYLVGHSYGSYLGMLVAARYPKLIAAYVGVGQVAYPKRTRELQDRFFRRQAEASGNRKLLEQLNYHKPIDREHWLFEYHAELYHATSWWPLLRIGLEAPEYKLSDALDIPRGVSFTHKYLKYDAIHGPLTKNVKSLNVPVYFFLGRHDYTAPSSLASAYLKALTTPRKEIVWFDDSAHFPFLEQSKKFAAEMLQVYHQTSGV
jgi:pimeloyl-ACP methyl ester carboxylesterase